MPSARYTVAAILLAALLQGCSGCAILSPEGEASFTVISQEAMP